MPGLGQERTRRAIASEAYWSLSSNGAESSAKTGRSCCYAGLYGVYTLARDVFHTHRGQLRQRYRECPEDPLGALGLVVNAIVL